MPLRRNGSVRLRGWVGGGVGGRLCDTAMYLAEEQVSRREAAFPRVTDSEGKAVLSVSKCHIFGAC